MGGTLGGDTLLFGEKEVLAGGNRFTVGGDTFNVGAETFIVGGDTLIVAALRGICNYITYDTAILILCYFRSD